MAVLCDNCKTNPVPVQHSRGRPFIYCVVCSPLVKRERTRQRVAALRDRSES